MVYLLLITSLLIFFLCFAIGQSCTTPSGETGRCVPISECQSLMTLLFSSSPEERLLVTNSRCGLNDGNDGICCPLDRCTTPDGFQGTCVALRSCPHLADKAQTKLTNDERLYLQRSRYNGSVKNSVCCALLPDESSSTPKPNESCQMTVSPPDPTSQCCGMDSGNIRIVGGQKAGIGEYPWTALMEYTTYNHIETSCGGALISGQYVLTAGHCQGNGYKSLDSVRLGEYDTDNPDRDCIPVPGGGEDCTDGSISVPVQDITVHPNYTYGTLIHDIALIRLVRIVEYTDFIRPICLPTVDFTTSSPESVYMHVAGWGATETEMSSNIQLKIRLPYVPHEKCAPKPNIFTRFKQLHNGQICAGGESGKDSCSGDSGSPLMREVNNFLELVGLVSYGPNHCGTKGKPAVYTKVFYYLPWIRSEIAKKKTTIKTVSKFNIKM